MKVDAIYLDNFLTFFFDNFDARRVGAGFSLFKGFFGICRKGLVELVI